MKGKVLKPHPNRSCDLMQLPCQNLSSGKPVGHLGGQRVQGASTAAARLALVWEEASENHAGCLGMQKICAAHQLVQEESGS